MISGAALDLPGFVPALQLFFYKVSGTQTGPFEANTGLKFVTKGTVDPYLTTSTRYEGKSTKSQIVPRTGAIKG